MVSIVLVSKSLTLANGIKELVNQTVERQVKLTIATNHQTPLDLVNEVSPETILYAIKEAYHDDGVLILLDTYHSAQNAALAIANLEYDIAAHVSLCSAPIVEGTLAAASCISLGASLEEAKKEAHRTISVKKFQLGENLPDFTIYPKNTNYEPVRAITAPVWLYPYNRFVIPRKKLYPHLLLEEQKRLINAIEQSKRDIDWLTEEVHRRLGGQYTHIFSSHRFLLENTELQLTVCSMINKHHCNAEFALQQTFIDLIDTYAQMDDDNMRARESDLDDILSRMLRYLTSSPPPLTRPPYPNAILVTKQLHPSTLMTLEPNRIKGIVLSHGNPLSNTTVLANALDIPIINEAGKLALSLIDGQNITLKKIQNMWLYQNSYISH
ncbi:phosphoenolpyruvate-utilizing N-terminal domain-containing protein [Proteus hauseri]|uniref:phosphoenolpyruvate-utilizing N-terminal domain-containing protein n=1 Tax=Proteus hauseri TaxID=183417 RepID=UPI0032DADD64